jgi:hypothetical protein
VDYDADCSRKAPCALMRAAWERNPLPWRACCSTTNWIEVDGRAEAGALPDAGRCR